MRRIKKHFLNMFIKMMSIKNHESDELSLVHSDKFHIIFILSWAVIMCVYFEKEINYIICIILVFLVLKVCTKMRYQEGSTCFINKKFVLHLPFIGFFKIIKCSDIVDIGFCNFMINSSQRWRESHHVVKEYIYISTIPVDLKILANLFVRHWKNRHIIIVPATEHNIEVLTKEYGFKINKKYRNKLTYENYGNYIYGKKQFEEIKKRPF